MIAMSISDGYHQTLVWSLFLLQKSLNLFLYSYSDKIDHLTIAFTVQASNETFEGLQHWNRDGVYFRWKLPCKVW